VKLKSVALTHVLKIITKIIVLNSIVIKTTEFTILPLTAMIIMLVLTMLVIAVLDVLTQM